MFYCLRERLLNHNLLTIGELQRQSFANFNILSSPTDTWCCLTRTAVNRRKMVTRWQAWRYLQMLLQLKFDLHYMKPINIV